MRRASPPNKTQSPSSGGRAGSSQAPLYSGKTYLVDRSYGYLMRRVQASLLRHIDTRFKPHELTALQWGPLLLLAQGKGDTAAALARALDIDTGAMTRMLDRLEAKQLIRRVRSAADRRINHLELTIEGKRLAAQVPDVISEVLNLHLQGFSATELKQLINFLERMHANGQSASAS